MNIQYIAILCVVLLLIVLYYLYSRNTGSVGGGSGSGGNTGGGSGSGGRGESSRGWSGKKLPCGLVGPNKVSLNTTGYNNPIIPVSPFCVPDSENILYLSSQNQQYFFGINQNTDSNNNTTGYLFIQNTDGTNVWTKNFTGNGEVVLMATTGGQLYAADAYGNTIWCGICHNIPLYNTVNAYLTLSNTGVLSVVSGMNQIIISR